MNTRYICINKANLNSTEKSDCTENISKNLLSKIFSNAMHLKKNPLKPKI